MFFVIRLIYTFINVYFNFIVFIWRRYKLGETGTGRLKSTLVGHAPLPRLWFISRLAAVAVRFKSGVMCSKNDSERRTWLTVEQYDKYFVHDFRITLKEERYRGKIEKPVDHIQFSVPERNARQ